MRDDLITDCEGTDDHEESIATSIHANVVAVLETLNDSEETIQFWML